MDAETTNAAPSSRDAVAEAYDQAVESGSVDEVQPDAGDGDTGDYAPESATGRDGRGRFAPGVRLRRAEKPATEAAEGAETAAPETETAEADTPGTETPTAKPQDRLAKAPQSWRNDARTQWDKLPPAVRAEIHRLDAEARITATRAGKEGEFANSIRSVVEPFAPLLQASGLSAPQAIGGALRVLATLERGSPKDRAQMIAQYVRSYLPAGEDGLTLLAQALNGGAPPANNAQPTTPAPEQIDPGQIRAALTAHVDEQVQTRLIEEDRRIARETFARFATTKPEFLNEVRREMIDILAARGVQRPSVDDLRDAYDAACRNTRHVRAVIDMREAVAERKKARESVDRAVRAAAASGRSDSSGGTARTEVKARDTHGEVTRQFDLSDRRRGKR